MNKNEKKKKLNVDPAVSTFLATAILKSTTRRRRSAQRPFTTTLNNNPI